MKINKTLANTATFAKLVFISVLVILVNACSTTTYIGGSVSSAVYQEIPLEKTFYIIESEKQTLTETNIQSLLARELESRGLHRTDSFNNADYLVEYTYSVGDGTTSLSSMPDPVFGGHQVSSVTNYPRYFQVSMIDVAASNREKKHVYSWQAEIYSSGSSKNISWLAESFVPVLFEHYGQTVSNEAFRKFPQ